MPPLLCLSPVLIDQSFPRDEAQLRTVAIALGEIFSNIRLGKARLVLTQTLREFVDNIDWTKTNHRGLLQQIYRDLSQMFLQTHGNIIVGNVSNVTEYALHPIPQSAIKLGFVDFWADELGKLLVLHERNVRGHEYFLGIACESAFSGGIVGSYPAPLTQRAFPLVGPSELSTILDDAFEWDIPANCHNLVIGVSDVCRNFRQLGAVALEPPERDSHYKLRFSNGSFWTLDYSWGRSIGEKTLNELKEYCGMPLNVIKYCLKNGKRPPRRLRLDTR
jgi:hypothetical protein